MIGLAANGSISFSDAPLRLALGAGAAVSVLAFIYGLSVIGRWVLSDPSLERGWSSTIVIIAALGGANMLMTGVIALYVGRIYAEAKGRPLYIVYCRARRWFRGGAHGGSTGGGNAELSWPARQRSGRPPPRPHETKAGRSARRFAFSLMTRRL
jgi:hypothetical protein